MIFDFLKTNVIKILAGLCLVLALGLTVQSIRLAHAHNETEAEKNASVAQVNEYTRVYNETYQRQFAAKIAEDARLLNIKGEADNATIRNRSSALDHAATYRRDHRCVLVSPEVNSSSSGQQGRGDLPGLPAPAGGPGAPAPAGDLVAISSADFKACTLNTVDYGIAFEWAQKLHNP